ncbi:uncharacterized protein ARMOST_16835 [Armillaria ostoyae]|uniref:Uncharacterized protein n=1 Tax=Armillaria ostoyae TaxID=47428 RepID=A0A284RXC7_ARMOS|nr:uncharacterized protein ARMOST_16835 [Armillaria ostoyae]
MPPPSPPPEMNDRDLRARYDSFPPPAYDPHDIPIPERALIPHCLCPVMAFPTTPAQRIFIREPHHLRPYPDSSSEDEDPFHHPAPAAHQLPPPEQFITISSNDKDLNHLTPPASEPDVPESVSGSDCIPSLPSRPLAFTYRTATDPLNIDGPDFEWNELSTVDILILGPHRTATWELCRRDVEARYELRPDDRTPMGWYLTVERGDPIPSLGRDATIATRIFHN